MPPPKRLSAVVVTSPLGLVHLLASSEGVCRLEIGAQGESPQIEVDADKTATGHLCQARSQLAEYFAGHRTVFDLPCDLSSLSPFVHEVLLELCRVPYGTTISYGELAAQVGRPRSARAIGRAMATNPLPLIIPCHRVVGKGGALTGYSGGGGIVTKEWLLAHEAKRTVW